MVVRVNDDKPDPATTPAGDLPSRRIGDALGAGPAEQAPLAAEQARLSAEQTGLPAKAGRKGVYLVRSGSDIAEPELRGESWQALDELSDRASVGVLDDGDGDGGNGNGHDGSAHDGSDFDESDEREQSDWKWVEEWRAGQEPTPWATGLVLAGFSALVVGVAIWVLCAGLADRPVIAILVNAVVAAGLAPAMWLCRGLPVLRWIAAGALVGVIVGWLAAIVMLPLPLP